MQSLWESILVLLRSTQLKKKNCESFVREVHNHARFSSNLWHLISSRQIFPTPQFHMGNDQEQNSYTAVHKHKPGKCRFPVKTPVDWERNGGKYPMPSEIKQHVVPKLSEGAQRTNIDFTSCKIRFMLLLQNSSFDIFPQALRHMSQCNAAKAQLSPFARPCSAQASAAPQQRLYCEGAQGQHKLWALLHHTLDPRA